MIKIIYEDNHLLVVCKPVNMLSQSDSTKDADLLTKLKQYLKEKYQKPGNVYLGLVHRLDRMVGGIMVFAKTSKAAARLSEEIKNHEFKKTYLAIVDGNIKDSGVLEDYLLKDKKTNTTYVSNEGKFAKLSYEVIKNVNNLSLVKVNLETGRSHQIRVQFSSRGYPLWADNKYNKKAEPGMNLALWSYKIKFKHPITKEILEFKILPSKEKYPWNLF